MKKTNEIIQKIESHYVGEDCVQVTFPYQKTLTIINPDGILYHHKPGSNLYINKYVEDERRNQFPYSNIPNHFSKIMFKKISVTNQLLDFEKPYIRIGDGYFFESFVVKDNNQALLVNNTIKPISNTLHMTYDELLKYVGANNFDERVYYVYLTGEIPLNSEVLFPTEEEIYSGIKEQLLENVSYFEDEAKKILSSDGRRLIDNIKFLNYIKKCMKSIDYSLIDFNVAINDPMLIIRINNGDITMQGINVTFVKENDYRVGIYDIPVTKYTLEQLKYVSKIRRSKEPRIPLRLNPGVSRQDIKEAKQMIKTLKKRS